MWHVGNFTNTQFFTFSTIHVKIPFYWQLPYKLPPGPLQGHWQQIIFDLILYQRFSTILAGDNVRFVTIFSHAYQSFFLHICTKLCLPIARFHNCCHMGTARLLTDTDCVSRIGHLWIALIHLTMHFAHFSLEINTYHLQMCLIRALNFYIISKLNKPKPFYYLFTIFPFSKGQNETKCKWKLK